MKTRTMRKKMMFSAALVRRLASFVNFAEACASRVMADTAGHRKQAFDGVCGPCAGQTDRAERGSGDRKHTA